MCIWDLCPVGTSSCVQVLAFQMLIWGEVEEFGGSSPSSVLHPPVPVPLETKQPQCMLLPPQLIQSLKASLFFACKHIFFHWGQSLSCLTIKLFSRSHLACPSGQLQISVKFESVDFWSRSFFFKPHPLSAWWYKTQFIVNSAASDPAVSWSLNISGNFLSSEGDSFSVHPDFGKMVSK